MFTLVYLQHGLIIDGFYAQFRHNTAPRVFDGRIRSVTKICIKSEQTKLTAIDNCLKLSYKIHLLGDTT